jgi:hypothetical protein
MLTCFVPPSWPHDATIRYLGVHSCFDGNCSAQQRKSLDMVMLFIRVVSKFKLSVGRAVYMFNVFLLPKLELALHYVHGRGTNEWVMNLDRLLIGSITHVVKSPLILSHSAAALAVGLTLPSWLETSARVSDVFLRMNSSDSRWSSLGRMLMREQCPASIDSVTFNARTSAGSRLQRAAKLAVTHLGWCLQQEALRRPGSRHQHLFDIVQCQVRPSCPSSKAHQRRSASLVRPRVLFTIRDQARVQRRQPISSHWTCTPTARSTGQHQPRRGPS